MNCWCKITPINLNNSYQSMVRSIYPHTREWKDQDWITFSKFGDWDGQGFWDYNAKFELLRTQGKTLAKKHCDYSKYDKYLANIQQVCVIFTVFLFVLLYTLHILCYT